METSARAEWCRHTDAVSPRGGPPLQGGEGPCPSPSRCGGENNINRLINSISQKLEISRNSKLYFPAGDV